MQMLDARVCVTVPAAVAVTCALFPPCQMDYGKFSNGLNGLSVAVGGQIAPLASPGLFSTTNAQCM